MNSPTLAYIVEKDGKDFVAKCPVLHISEYGKTRADAVKNLAEMEAETLEIEKELGNKLPTYEESLNALNAIKRGGYRVNSGRKPKAEEQIRNKRITIYVSAAELEKINKLAKKAKFESPSKYMLNLAIG